MIPIIMNELRRRRWSIIWWSIGIVTLIALTLLFYPTIQKQGAQISKSFGNFSPQVTALLSDTGDLFSPIGYLSSKIYYLLLPLMLSILAIGLGSSLIARDERDHTLELLLARPISRTRVVAAKAVSGLLVVGAVATISTVVNLTLTKLIGINLSLRNIVFTMLMATLLSLIFGAIAFALTAMGRTARLASIGIASLVALLGYLATSFESLVHWMSWPARVLPYHYYRPAEILGGKLMWMTAMWFGVVILGLGVVAAIGFRRRDID